MHGKLNKHLFAAFVALGFFARTASADTKTDDLKAFREDKRIDLPPFLVMEDAQKGARPWAYLSAPGLEVLSKCSDATTLWFAEQFLQRLAELQEILPTRLQFGHTVPTALILIPPEMTAKMGKEIATMIRESEFGERTTRVTDNWTDSSYYRMVPQVSFTDLESLTIMVELNGDDRSNISLTNGYVLSALQRRTPPLPYWFQSTMFSLYQEIHWTDSRALTIPSVYWPKIRIPVDPASPRVKAKIEDGTYTISKSDDGKSFYRLAPAPPIPIQKFLLGPCGGAEEGIGDQLDLWHSQASLFLHWIFDDESDKRHFRRRALWDFVDKSSREPTTEELFRQCFSMGYGDLDNELTKHLPQAMKEPLNLLDVDSVPIPKLNLRNADPVTRARIQGDFFVKEMMYMAKSPLSQYMPLYAARAEVILTQPYQSGARDPGLLSVLGLYYAEIGKDERARPLLQDAVNAHVTRPSVYVELARICYKEALAQPGGGKTEVNRERVGAILKLLKEASSLAPPQIETYQLARELWYHTELTPSVEDQAFLEQGEIFFPRNHQFGMGIAVPPANPTKPNFSR